MSCLFCNMLFFCIDINCILIGYNLLRFCKCYSSLFIFRKFTIIIITNNLFICLIVNNLLFNNMMFLTNIIFAFMI